MASFYIDQHGCAKNQTDGELLAGHLIKAGFTFSQSPDTADFIIINTCGFIQSAKKESIDAVYALKAAYPKAKIIMAGCLAQRYADELYEQMPELDGIFGNGDLSKITEYMTKKSKRKPLVTPQQGVCSGERPYIFNFKGSAYVKITEGCSNNCSFCAIPLIRGPVRSRPVNEIIKEIKALVKNGIYEINLIGQDLAAFTCKLPENQVYSSPLAYLLSKISEIKGDFVIRALYIHPDHFDTDILQLYKSDPRFLHYFDIPFQSGDDNIIKAMNRKGSAKEYISLVKQIRKELPDAAIRTTFLTGFPGETEEAALNTQNFLKSIKPFWSGCFAYSREEGTAAWNYKPRINQKTAQLRADALSTLQTEYTYEQLSA